MRQDPGRSASNRRRMRAQPLQRKIKGSSAGSNGRKLLGAMQKIDDYATSSSVIGFQSAQAKKQQEFFPKCAGAATFKFIPVHNVGWSLPINPMKKSITHQNFSHPLEAYSASQLKLIKEEASISVDFCNKIEKLSSGVRLQPPILTSLSTDTYKKPAKYGYQQNIFKYKNSAPLSSKSEGKDEETGENHVEHWKVKKDFAFVREGDGGRNVLEIRDSKKNFVGLGYRPESSIPVSRHFESLSSTTNQYQTSNRQYLTDHSELSEKLEKKTHQKMEIYRSSLESSKLELMNYAPRPQKTNFRVFENVGGVPVIHEAKDAHAQAMRKLVNFVKPSAAKSVLQDIIYTM